MEEGCTSGSWLPRPGRRQGQDPDRCSRDLLSVGGTQDLMLARPALYHMRGLQPEGGLRGSEGRTRHLSHLILLYVSFILLSSIWRPSLSSRWTHYCQQFLNFQTACPWRDIGSILWVPKGKKPSGRPWGAWATLADHSWTARCSPVARKYPEKEMEGNNLHKVQCYFPFQYR
jgi:hypothetical protein